MAKISQLTIPGLGTVIQLLLNLIRGTNNTELLTSKQRMEFEKDAQLYIGALNKMDASLYSSEVATKEKRRDTSISALFKHVKSLTASPIAAKRDAAKRVLAVLNVHGNISFFVGLSQNDKTSRINTLLTHIAAEVSAEDMATLDLAPWVDEVKQAQADYLAIYIRRSDANASQADITSASTQRPQLEKSLNKLIDFVNAKATLDADPFWHDLSLRIEERISEVARTQRVKPRAAKRTKPEDKPALGE